MTTTQTDVKNHLKVKESTLLKGVYYLTDPASMNGFEEAYMNTRKRERRFYTDDELMYLPHIGIYHPHHDEWKLREESLKRFKDYIESKEKPLSILDVGCGNGWFANQLAHIEGLDVVALDVNSAELQQASRVFFRENLHFVYGDVFSNILPAESFDMVVVNSSIQYFPNLSEVISRLKHFIKPGGELHIMDSPFYPEKKVEKARERSLKYYEEIGSPQMANKYFHHTDEELKTFSPEYLYKPSMIGGMLKSLGAKHHPFPWVKINK